MHQTLSRPPLWRRLSRRAAWTIAVIVVVLVGVRIALHFVVEDYVNRRLNEIPGYSGHVDTIHLHLWRGAYEIDGVRLDKENGNVPVPLFAAPKIDLSMQWHELFHGAVVGQVRVLRPELNFVQSPQAAARQTSVDSSWIDTVKRLFPFDINRLEIDGGSIHYRDFHTDPKVDIHLDEIQADAEHLTNRPKDAQALFAWVQATGRPLGHGEFRFRMTLNPLQSPPPFALETALRDLSLPSINDFLRAYGKFDVEAGTFSAYMELRSEGGRYQGYVKPFFQGIKVGKKGEHKSLGQKLWEAVVSGASKILENPSHKDVATRVPISGSLENPKAGLVPAIFGLLRNAFIRAITPGLEGSVFPTAPGNEVAGGKEAKNSAGKQKEKTSTSPRDDNGKKTGG